MQVNTKLLIGLIEAYAAEPHGTNCLRDSALRCIDRLFVEKPRFGYVLRRNKMSPFDIPTISKVATLIVVAALGAAAATVLNAMFPADED